MLTAIGKFYLAAVVDLYARFTAGWAVSALKDRSASRCSVLMASAPRAAVHGT
jgi:transposase InsO family protein